MKNRALPGVEERQDILIAQRGLCLYCFEPLDGRVFRKGKRVELRLEWDHMVPYSYLVDNPVSNWAASCQVCNGIKSDLMFDTIEDARDHIRDRRNELGISSEPPLFSWVEDAKPDDDEFRSVPEHRYCACECGLKLLRKDGLPDRKRVWLNAEHRKRGIPVRPVDPKMCAKCGEPRLTGVCYCDNCRCQGTNSKGDRCEKLAEIDGRCEYHPVAL